jgi:lipoprotein NlpD
MTVSPAALAAVLMIAVCAGACFEPRPPMHPETPSGRWYVVGPGETLAEISARSGVPAEDILEINGLDRASDVRAGELLFLLDGDAPEPPRTALGPPPVAPGVPSVVVASAALRWPLDGARSAVFIGSPFGARHGRAHEGIDLPAPTGTPVYAAADGLVVYAGDGIRGYGNLLVVQHAGDLLTVYAHNSALLVHQGASVQAGQRIALVGQSGRATGPHLHFEVRRGQIPQDPMTFLPSRTASREGGTP